MKSLDRMIALAVVSVCLLTAWRAPAQEKAAKPSESGFKPLFDLPRFWIYNGEKERWAFSGNGVIVSEGEGGGWLMHPQQFGDLELHLEYKMRKGGNSGVTLRCPPQPPTGVVGFKAEPALVAYEIQLMDDDNHPAGNDPFSCTGAIFGIAPALKRNVNRPLGDWNSLRILARGTKVTVTLNGETVQEVDLKKYAAKARGNPHFLETRGHVGLQSWKGRVEFRNLRIKEL